MPFQFIINVEIVVEDVIHRNQRIHVVIRNLLERARKNNRLSFERSYPMIKYDGQHHSIIIQSNLLRRKFEHQLKNMSIVILDMISMLIYHGIQMIVFVIEDPIMECIELSIVFH